jgi:single-stranded DNA-specific DHH superfamily exonuclease
MQQLNLFEKTEEEKEENRFADKIELSEEERLELARAVYRVFKEDIEEIKDTKTGKIIYRKEDAPPERAGSS